MQKRPEIVQTAEKVAAGEADAPAPREALTGLLEAHKKLRNRYLYLLHEGHPEPVHTLDGADSLEELSERWRDEADTLRAHGAASLADLCEKHAGELEQAAEAQQWDTVTLEEAESIGGYSYSHLQHLVSEGTIPNAGRPGTPRIRRADVPVKPGHSAATSEPDLTSRKGWLAKAVETA